MVDVDPASGTGDVAFGIGDWAADSVVCALVAAYPEPDLRPEVRQAGASQVVSVVDG